jgi:4-coumarate--CoA ligase
MSIIHSRFAPVALTGLTITERLFQGLAGRAEAAVVVDGPTGRSLTGGQVMEGIRRLAGGLAAQGFGPGQVLAILAPNMPEYVIAFHGPLWAGGTVTTLNPSYTAAEIHHQLENSGASLLVTIAPFLAQAREGAAGTSVREIVVIGGAEGHRSLDDLLGQELARQVPVDVERDTAVLPYSSGTTGLPKGVMLTHRNLVVNVDQMIAISDIGLGGWTVAFLPFFHIYGQTVLMNGHLAAGAGVVTMPRFDLELFLRLCAEYRTPNIYCAPPVVVALAKHPMVDQFNLSAVKRLFSGAAPLSGDLADAVGRRMGVQAVQGYGMTEMSPISHATPTGGGKSGSIGPLVPNTEARLVDPATGADAAPGEEGELWIRGPQVMKGYHANPAATASTLTPDGWLRTGDLAVADEDGWFFIRDRLKELIKVSGFQVAPAEVEAALLSHPAIADCAVTARPDDHAGEVPVAFVVRAKGAEVSEDQVIAHLAGMLASYKLPRAVTWVETIPKSPSGKILRRMLRQG